MQWSDLLEPLDWGRQAVTNAGEGAAGLLGGDFSRDNFAKTIPAIAGLGAGLLTGGTMAPLAGAGAAALTQGVGKFFNPRAMQAMSTGDLVEKLGGDRDSTWQNMGMHLATDPFTYAGIGMAGGAAKGAEAAGLAGAGEAATGGSRLGDVLASMKSGGSGTSGLRASMGFATPGNAVAEATASTGSKLSDMLKARRGIASLTTDGSGNIAQGPGQKLIQSELDLLKPRLNKMFEGPGAASGVSGTSESGTPFMAMPASPRGLHFWRGPEGSFETARLPVSQADAALAKSTGRHELYHALVKTAAQQPSSEGSGLGLLGRATAGLYRGAEPGSARESLALLLNETGAHAVEEGSIPLRQAIGGADFLFGLPKSNINRAYYSSQLGARSPLIGGLYDALGIAPKAAGLGGVAAGTAYAGNRLMRE